MNSKKSLHLALGLFLVAGLIAGIGWLANIRKDPDFGTSDTSGYLAAIEYLPNGSRAIVIKPDGKILPAPDYPEGATDKEPVWRPDGNRLFFTSDREENTFHIYRWNIGRNIVERRSLDQRAKSNATFGPAGHPAALRDALILSGGVVQQFNPSTAAAQQILPPLTMVAGDEGGGAGSTFQNIYSRFGSSFKSAKWGKNREYIVAIMKGDIGEVLIVQYLTAQYNEKTGENRVPPPAPLLAGEKLDFDINANGDILVAQLGFRFPVTNSAQIPKEFIKGDRAVPPYKNGLILFPHDQPAIPLGLEQGKRAYWAPRFSPDGSQVIAQTGTYSEEDFVADQLVIFPTSMGLQQASPVIQGKVLEAEWHPNGNKLVYVKRENGRRSIFSINKDGTSNERLTNERSDYGSPRYSPQSK